MTLLKISGLSIKTAGILTFTMGLFHFFLPEIFPWQERITEMYAPVKWALFSSNFFFSFLLVWGGIWTFCAAPSKKQDKYASKNMLVLAGMASFWAAGFIYETVVPFPVGVARWILPGFSGLLALMYLPGLVYYRPLEER